MNPSTITNPQTAPYPLSKYHVEQLYVDETKTLNEIAAIAGTSRQRLARWMTYWGIERRESRQAMDLRRAQMGETRGPNWQGGRWWAASQKTWWVYAPNHPKVRHNGGVPEHILNAEERIGRYLREGEVVHHLDANRQNNDGLNLCVMSSSQHLIVHRALGDAGIALMASHPTLVIQACPETVRGLMRAIYIDRLPILPNQTTIP